MNGTLQRFGDDVGATADKDHVLGGGQLFGPGHGGRHLFHRLAAEIAAFAVSSAAGRARSEWACVKM